MCDIELLKNRIKELESENRELKGKLCIAESRLNKKTGRKRMFKEHDIESMKFYRFQGKSYSEISKIFKCSVGLVYKLINE